MNDLRSRVARVSRRDVERNLAVLRAGREGGFLADLRADAFGHGLLGAAAVLVDSGASGLLVSTIDDAVLLRGASVTVPLWVVGPPARRGAGAPPHGVTLGSPTDSSALSVLGAELFGVSEGSSGPVDGCSPAMTLVAPVMALKRHAAGEGVSYGYTYRTQSETTLALVPVGYGDGVDRSLGNRARVVVGGRSFTIAGRMAMDACVLDVGDSPVEVGDPVVFFGDPEVGAPHVAEWATLLGVTTATVTACLTGRVERRWV